MTPRVHLSSETVACYEFAEVTLELGAPVGDPFRTVTLRGECAGRAVDGFCDSQDGSVHRIRFLPTRPGLHRFRVTLTGPETEYTHEGAFLAVDAGLPGLLEVDPDHPWHFRWSGTGRHFFWNATTAYQLPGCTEPVISESLARFQRLGVNRIRVALSPARVRDAGAWRENVPPTDEFTYLYGPWLAARPESVDDPGWDVARFDVAYWRKFERLVEEARDRGIVVSVIFFLDGANKGAYPYPRDIQGGDPDEENYYRYAAARLAAYANVMWDVTNEYQLFRTEAWVERTAAFLRERDPYGHLMSVHGHPEFPFRTSPWADLALYQSWDKNGGYEFMLANRRKQIEAGRPIPQVNEEYGYEDHYPHWGKDTTVAPGRSADNRRRLAWEMTMAGGYQTTGESAENGLGGWVNGRGDDSMRMMEGYARLAAFFTQLPWWKLEPRPDLAGGAMCLAEPGARYVVYLPAGGDATLALEGGPYAAAWYDPRTGETHTLPDTFSAPSATLTAPDADDWALHLWRAEG